MTQIQVSERLQKTRAKGCPVTGEMGQLQMNTLKIFQNSYRSMLKTLETIKSAGNKGPKEASINHWLYIVEITLITTIVFFAMLLVMAIFITDFGVLTDIKRLTWMLASFTLLPLLFAKRAKQLFFRFSFAQLSFQQACVFIAIKLLILIWLIFEYFTAVSHVAHAVTYHELALYLKGIKLPLLMIAVYLVLSYMGLIISNLFASLKVNSSKSIIRALIGANILLLHSFRLILAGSTQKHIFRLSH